MYKSRSIIDSSDSESDMESHAPRSNHDNQHQEKQRAGEYQMEGEPREEGREGVLGKAWGLEWGEGRGEVGNRRGEENSLCFLSSLSYLVQARVTVCSRLCPDYMPMAILISLCGLRPISGMRPVTEAWMVRL